MRAANPSQNVHHRVILQSKGPMHDRPMVLFLARFVKFRANQLNVPLWPMIQLKNITLYFVSTLSVFDKCSYAKMPLIWTK